MGYLPVLYTTLPLWLKVIKLGLLLTVSNDLQDRVTGTQSKVVNQQDLSNANFHLNTFPQRNTLAMHLVFLCIGAAPQTLVHEL